MKILFTGEYSNLPGDPAPLFVSRTLYDAINKSDNDTFYLAYFQDGKKYSRWQKLFGKEVIDKSKNIYRLGIFPYIFFVSKINPDIINLINFQLFYAVLFPIKIFSSFKIVYTMHGINSYELKYFYRKSNFQRKRLLFAEYLIMKFSDRIFSLSELSARYIRRNYKLKGKNIEVVPNGIKTTNKYKLYSDFSKSVLNCYFIGDPDRTEKRFPFLKNILFEENIYMNIAVYGAKISNETSHKRRINIRFYEYIENELLREQIINYDLFIRTSTIENFSLSLLECMAAGILFLASDRDGLTERFDEKLKKLVFRYNSKKSFLSKLNYVNNLSVNDKRELSEHTRKFAAVYSIENVSDFYLKLYQKLLGSNK